MRLSATEIKSAAPSIRWLCRSLGQLNWLRNVLSSNETAGCNTPSRCSAGRPFGFTRVLMGAGWMCAPPEWIQALAHRMEHDIGRREARFVWHILFEAIRAIDALQAARTVLQREFCVWTQAEPAA